MFILKTVSMPSILDIYTHWYEELSLSYIYHKQIILSLDIAPCSWRLHYTQRIRFLVGQDEDIRSGWDDQEEARLHALFIPFWLFQV